MILLIITSQELCIEHLNLKMPHFKCLEELLTMSIESGKLPSLDEMLSLPWLHLGNKSMAGTGGKLVVSPSLLASGQ